MVFRVSYRVFARKYRPQRFEEVVGQEHITRTLQNAIKGNRLAQAYLFVGPRGVGKTSTARILAKALNCQNGPTDNPCSTCDACLEIAEGRSLDVLEIDGASNNSVESIRTLRENAAYAPARGPYKVYLIDEVHMLSTAAFNALLKTLEEPPKHVKFLFATTEAQKVPATILSRCQRFDLRRLTPELIASHLLYIAKSEKIDLEPAAAAALAKGADGALRDAESMLDQVVAFCGTTISADNVHAVFGFTPHETVLELGRTLLDRDTPAALALVKNQADAGKDLSRLLGDLVGLLRDVLICKVHPPQEASNESILGNTIPQEKLLVLLDHFGEAEGRLRWATDKKLQLDVAMIKAVHLLEEASLSDVIDLLSTLRSGGVPAEPIRQKPSKTPLPPTRVESVRSQSADATAESLLSSKEECVAAPAVETSRDSSGKKEVGSVAQAAKDGDCSTTSDPWYPVAMSLVADSPLKFGWLEDGRFLEVDGKSVIVEFPPSLESQTGTQFWMQAVKKIEEKISANFGTKITLVCRFTGSEPPPPPLEPPHATAPKTMEKNAPIPKAAAEFAVPAISPGEMEAFKNDPLIKKALEIFKAEILISAQTH